MDKDEERDDVRSTQDLNYMPTQLELLAPQGLTKMPSTPAASPETAGGQPIMANDVNAVGLETIASASSAGGPWPPPPRQQDALEGITDGHYIPDSTQVDNAANNLDEAQVPRFLQEIQYPQPPDQPTQVTLDKEVEEGDVMEALYDAAIESGVFAHAPRCDYKGWPFPARSVSGPTGALYDAARSAFTRDTPHPRVDHTTDLLIDIWVRESTGHPADQLVLDGLRFGFPIQYKGPPVVTPTAKYNHHSAEAYSTYVDKYMDKETSLGALDGPYEAPPFVPWFVASPLMTREKDGGDGRRIIVDLSFPEGGINKYIAPHVFNGGDATHNLPTITSAVETIAATCPGDIHLAVVDLSRAYRQFPVHPLDWPLLGIYWKGAWSFDRRLPFGSRMSSYIMQTIAEFLVRALATRGIHAHMYLDDIIIVSTSKDIAMREYRDTIKLLGDLGLTVAPNKIQPPAPAVRWLGIWIDVSLNQLSIPEGKLTQIKNCMATAARRKFITKKHLQRLIGLANHVAKIVRAARIFICRILAALRASTTDNILVTPAIRADLAWYARYLADYNGRAIIPARRVVRRVWADACLKGAGASDGSAYYEHTFTRDLAANHIIAHLEALNCVAAARTFISVADAGGTVEIFCDNRPSVDAFTSGRARDPVLAACTRALWYQAAVTDTDICFTHTPGEKMDLPDALSRAANDQVARRRADRLISSLKLVSTRPPKGAFSYSQFM